MTYDRDAQTSPPSQEAGFEFSDWTQKLWFVASNRSAPSFFATNRRLRFHETGGEKRIVSRAVASKDADESMEEKTGEFKGEVDEVTLQLSEDPPLHCVISRFAKSSSPSREVLVGRIFDEDRGEAGSWTAVDGDGTGGGEG